MNEGGENEDRVEEEGGKGTQGKEKVPCVLGGGGVGGTGCC